MRFRCRSSLPVLATLAGDETVQRGADMKPPPLFEVVGTSHNFALGSQAHSHRCNGGGRAAAAKVLTESFVRCDASCAALIADHLGSVPTGTC
jgi:hypothetical protein